MKDFDLYLFAAALLAGLFFSIYKGLMILPESLDSLSIALLLLILINIPPMWLINKNKNFAIKKNSLLWKIKGNSVLRWLSFLLLVVVQFLLIIFGLSEGSRSLRSLLILAIFPSFIIAALTIPDNKN